MAFDLFDLSAKISVQTAEFDRKLEQGQKKVQALTSDLHKLDRQTGATGTGFGSLGGKAVVAESSLGSLSGLLPTLAGGATLVTAALGGTAAALWSLIRTTAEESGKLKDLSQQTGFSVETLSALGQEAERTGGSIDTVSGSLIIFQKNMEEAHDPASEQSRIFKALNIDIENSEKALRQAFETLVKMPEGYQQTAVAMKLFGRSGKELLAVLKETGGDIDGTIEKLRAMGTLITTDTAERADYLNDRLNELGHQFSGVGRIVAEEFYPITSRSVTDLSRLITENQGRIHEWVSEFELAASGAYRLGSAVMQLNGLLTGLSGIPIPAILNILAGMTPWIGLLGIAKQFGTAGFPSAPDPRGGASMVGFATPRINLGGSGGGGGGRGGGPQKDVLDSLKSSLVGLNAEFRKYDTELFNSANMSALAAEKEKLLANVMSSLKTETKMTISAIKDVDKAIDAAIGLLPKKAQASARALVDQSLAQFKANEQSRIAGELTKQSEELTKEWRQEIDNTRSGADQYTIAIQNLEAAHRKLTGQGLSPAIRTELEYQATIRRTLALTRERLTILAQTRPRVVGEDVLKDLGGGSVVFRGEASRPRVATVELQVMREEMERLRERAAVLAADFTSLFSNALHEGFQNGILAGLQAFEMGILQMIESAALKALEKRLADIFTNLLGGGKSGGGIASTLGGIVLNSILGGLGGGGKGGIVVGTAGKAAGGSFGPNESFMVGEEGPERVFTGSRSGVVVPNNKSDGVVHNHYHTWNVTTPNAQSFLSGPTQYQIKKRMAEATLSGHLMG